jgi:NhaP-type Na+/H+ or K+/H+ antiporter
MNWYIVLLTCLGLLILAVAWLPALLRRLPLSLPIICVAFGFALFGMPGTGPAPNLIEHPHLTEHLTELIVIVALMGAGLKLNRPLGWRSWIITWRLLAITMPLSIAAIALLGWSGLALAPAAALLLGAVLAPTDPVLAADVQVGPPHDPEEDEVRFSLTSEAGLNDGLAFPFVNLAVAMALHGAALGSWTTTWLAVDVIWKVAAGLALGLLVGQALGRLIFRYESRLPESGDNLVVLGITFLAYGLTELAHGYGFLAVFVAALTLRSQERSHHYRSRLHDFAEQIERLFMMILLVLFGGAVGGGLLAPLTWQAALVGLACLLLVRPLAGLIGLAGSGRPLDEQAAISFFGIRGIGSFYYLAHAYNAAKFEAEAEFLFALVGFVVLVSILLHGVSSTPVMRRLERRWRAERARQPAAVERPPALSALAAALPNAPAGSTQRGR